MIGWTLIITLISITPIPALPLIIFCYQKYTTLSSFFIMLNVSLLSTLFQYLIGTYISKKKLTSLKISSKFSSLKIKFDKIKLKDIIIIRFSNLFVVKFLNLYCGYIRYPLIKILLVNTLAISLWHFVYIFLALKVDLISEFFKVFGISIALTQLISIVSICSTLYLSNALIIFLYKYYNKIKQ